MPLLTHNRSFRGQYSQAINCTGTDNIKITISLTQKYKDTKYQKHRKVKPGLIASYDIWPGNGEGLFLFWHLINVTYLHTYTLTTYSQPQNPYGATTVINTDTQVQDTLSQIMY